MQKPIWPLSKRTMMTLVAASAIAAIVLGIFLWLECRGPIVEPPLARDVAIMISPHPDDESYALGQTIAHQTLNGRRVISVLLTDGEGSALIPRWIQSSGRDVNADGMIDKWDFASVRRSEFREAMRVLGVEEIIFMGRADSKGASGLEDTELAAEEVEELLRPLTEKYPGALWLTTAGYAPNESDLGDHLAHPDHVETLPAVLAAARAGGGTVYTFKVYVYLLPEYNRRAPFRVRGSSEELAMKREAIDAYSEIGILSTPELFEAASTDPFEYMVPIPLQ